MKKKIVLAAGGTGGHVLPAQAIAKELIEKGCDVAFAGCNLNTNSYLNRDLYSVYNIASAPLSYNIPSFAFHVTKGVVQSRSLFKRYEPDLIIGFGSYHTVPILAAATLLRKPFVLFAADAHPGKVVRLFSPYAQWTACYFEEAIPLLKGKRYMVQFPLRAQFAALPSREEALKRYGLSSDRAVILVLGGSSGAAAFNSLMPRAAALLNPPVSVLHICGKKAAAEEIQMLYQTCGISARTIPYEDSMEFAYQAADCVVARSGASTVAEIRYCSKRALYIPYPYAADAHQLKNAASAAAADVACVVEQALAAPKVIAENLQKLLRKPARQCGIFDSRKNFVELLDLIGCV